VPEECAYCGSREKLTRDHIPPRSLFGRPRPNDLITVPSCYPCNNGISKDDEYFNLFVKLGIDRDRFPKENADSVETIKNLARPRSRGFAASLAQKYVRGRPGGFSIDRSRVDAVLRRIVRGLFYYHAGTRMPASVSFEIVWIEEQKGVAAAVKGEIDALARNPYVLGASVFRYAFRGGSDFVSEWLLNFYDHRRFFCLTFSNALVAAEA